MHRLCEIWTMPIFTETYHNSAADVKFKGKSFCLWDAVCNITDCLVSMCLPNVSWLNSLRQRYRSRSTQMRFSMPAWNFLLTRTCGRWFPIFHKSQWRNKTVVNITENICNYYVNFANLIIMAKKRKGKWKSNYENLLFNLQFLKWLENCTLRTTHASWQQCFLREENKRHFLCFFHELKDILSWKIDLLHVIKLFHGSCNQKAEKFTRYNLTKLFHELKIICMCVCVKSKIHIIILSLKIKFLYSKFKSVRKVALNN